jgi:hypothetical protein
MIREAILAGAVVYPAGKPASGTTIEAISDLGHLHTSEINPDGTFEFRELLPGDYALRTKVSGFAKLYSMCRRPIGTFASSSSEAFQ